MKQESSLLSIPCYALKFDRLTMVHWHIIVNPASGAGKANDYADELTQKLTHAGVEFSIHQTQDEGDGQRIGKQLIHDNHGREADAGSGHDDGDDTSMAKYTPTPSHSITADEMTICVIGGDGTLHEIIQGIEAELYDTMEGYASANHTRICIALIPAGTANALFHSLYPNKGDDTANHAWASVEAALNVENHAPTKTTLTVVEVHTKHIQNSNPVSPQSHTRRPDAYACVVASTALHAQLLATASSSEMRKAHPGTERFRLAAMQHAGTVYQAKITLHPCNSLGSVQRYSPKTGKWEDEHLDGPLILQDTEYTYFVSALTDRFEETFVVAPHSSARERPSDAIDVVLVQAKPGLTKEHEAKRLFDILNAAYKNGEHIRMTETPHGDYELAGDGVPAVQYYRCGGFEWLPVRSPALGQTALLTDTIPSSTNPLEQSASTGRHLNLIQTHLFAYRLNY